jgi:uroporphyrinogen III methyltransferase / synthase
VLNTRPRSQAAELSLLLTRAGFEAVEAPAIDTAAAWDADELAAVRQSLRDAEYDWVVLASQNAGLMLQADLGQARLICGAATAAALSLTAEIALERFSASAALEVLEGRVVPGQRVLAPRAADGRDELVDGLNRLGVNVHAPIAYRTLAVDAAARRLRAGGIDVVTACSPSALASLLAAAGLAQLQSSTLVCLGDTTAAAARAAGLRIDAVAESTSMAALVAAVEAAVASGRASGVPA